LASELRPPIEANITHRSERGEELVRLLRLGALDAAFLWSTPPPPAGLHVVLLPAAAGGEVTLTLAGLTCSRLAEGEWSGILAVWRSEATRHALEAGAATPAKGTP
jgi:hypothetical protein